MTTRSLRLYCALALIAAAMFTFSASPAAAGGYWISLQTTKPASQDQAVIVVKSMGCHQPQDANISAEATGLVNGARKTMKLKMDQTSPGVYQIAKQWPSDGAWVLTITGQYNGLTSTALVRLGAGGSIPTIAEGSDGNGAVQMLRHRASAEEIDAAIHSSNKSTGPAATLKWQPIAGAGALLVLIASAAAFSLTRRKFNNGPVTSESANN